MLNTKLILIEGVPGSGKSTTAQFISKSLADCGIRNKWWYEEEKGHPVYVFQNDQSMKETVEDLSNGHYQRVVTQALIRWREFSRSLQATDEVIVVDSCFFGYLTWSLFPIDVSFEEISQYLFEVEYIISECKPCLIYFYQDDVYTSLKQICEKRGGETKENFINNACDSVYGKRRSLTGFNGMVSYWKDYRKLTDGMFNNVHFPKISIENSEGNWQNHLNRILNFLELPEVQPFEISQIDLNNYVGKYSNDQAICHIHLKDKQLVLSGIPQIWPNSRLLFRDHHVYEVESLPIKVTFMKDQLSITGPELFAGHIERVLFKEAQDGNRIEDV